MKKLFLALILALMAACADVPELDDQGEVEIDSIEQPAWFLPPHRFIRLPFETSTPGYVLDDKATEQFVRLGSGSTNVGVQTNYTANSVNAVSSNSYTWCAPPMDPSSNNQWAAYCDNAWRYCPTYLNINNAQLEQSLAHVYPSDSPLQWSDLWLGQYRLGLLHHFSFQKPAVLRAAGPGKTKLVCRFTNSPTGGPAALGLIAQ